LVAFAVRNVQRELASGFAAALYVSSGPDSATIPVSPTWFIANGVPLHFTCHHTGLHRAPRFDHDCGFTQLLGGVGPISDRPVEENALILDPHDLWCHQKGLGKNFTPIT
jgi:hypothetical protein